MSRKAKDHTATLGLGRIKAMREEALHVVPRPGDWQELLVRTVRWFSVLSVLALTVNVQVQYLCQSCVGHFPEQYKYLYVVPGTRYLVLVAVPKKCSSAVLF